MATVYLDNNATTRVDAEVVAAMLPFFTEFFGNPSSTHEFGAHVAPALKAARQQVQGLLGAAHDHEIVFTSGGTKSDTTAILSALDTLPERNEIVTSAVEHPAVLNLCQYLEKSAARKSMSSPSMRRAGSISTFPRRAFGQDRARHHPMGQ